VPWLTAHAGELQPAFTSELSRRLVESGRQEEGFEWFAVGMLRANYDARRCVDPTAYQGIMVLPQLAPNVTKQHRGKSVPRSVLPVCAQWRVKMCSRALHRHGGSARTECGDRGRPR